LFLFVATVVIDFRAILHALPAGHLIKPGPGVHLKDPGGVSDGHLREVRWQWFPAILPAERGTFFLFVFFFLRRLRAYVIVSRHVRRAASKSSSSTRWCRR
jgi:hypothetical protein